MDYVFVQDKKVMQLLNPDCKSAQRLKAMVCFTSLTEEEKDKATSIGIKPYSWKEFLHMGKENPSTIFPPQASNICTIMYTSGTSGDPKGVVLTHENIASFVGGIDLFLEQFEEKMTVEDVYLSFLPLAHSLDRTIEEYFFHKGASVGYYHGDITALRDDLMELKPTLFAGVPRVFEKIKARLGGRVRLIIAGGAPLSSEVEEFLRVTSCAYVCQGYGLTETCGSTTLAFPDEMCMLGTVGTISVYNEMQLEEVPEMGYNPLGSPPCGEICVRGKTVFTGYHKNPELTREAIRDGWFHTGDIGEIQPNGVVKIIDRKKNLIKLSQGEYIALEHLENVYGITPIVEDVWVYGDSFKSALVAVVVPNKEITKKWAYSNGHIAPFSELCSLDQLKKYVLSELKLTAERNKLKGFEHIKGVILEPHPFDMERELVTATMKRRRNNMLKYYQRENKKEMLSLKRLLLRKPCSRNMYTVTAAQLNDMINAYIHNNNNVNQARKLFDQNPSSRNLVSWNMMMMGYVQRHQIELALHLFDQMPFKDAVSWNIMLSGFQRTRNYDGLYHCFLQMGRAGVAPNDYTFSILLRAVINTELDVLVHQVHAQALHLALTRNVFVGSSLIKAYASLREEEALCRVFDDILMKDVTSWNALVSGYMEVGRLADAQTTFDLMPQRNMISWTTLVNGYVKNKRINKARSVFNKMSERNVVSWTIQGEKGIWSSVNELRDMMEERQIKKQKAISWVE
ncbi:Tetratricopeptide-like helical domain superfamily [Sesbania bispinosa]|nr:Tetratricopeptide-like helical domain superfamily [Sesbania bispinosa]